ncbi:MAG: hypothetical protein HUU55_21610 [Myxococcales bacterium]|nr:hypothetical protein [Myxococcales bacterium]
MKKSGLVLLLLVPFSITSACRPNATEAEKNKPAVTTHDSGPMAPGYGMDPAEAEALYRRLAKEANECPDGNFVLNGTWRFVGESKLPGFTDELSFQGNTFTEWMSAATGERGTVTGTYSCIYKNRILMHIKRADPDGLFGNRTDDAFACDVLFPIRPEERPKMLMLCFPEWNLDPKKSLDYEYERISD